MMCVVTGRLDNKDLGTVMQTLKKEVLVPLFCQVVIILIMRLQRPTAVIQRIITYFNGFVFISFCVLLFLFRNLKVAFILLFISVWVFGSYLLLFLQIRL
jgi:hypothetical protein